MLTDAQVYCMMSMIYLFRPPLTAKFTVGKRRKQSCTPNTYFDFSKLILYSTMKITQDLQRYLFSQTL